MLDEGFYTETSPQASPTPDTQLVHPLFTRERHRSSLHKIQNKI